MKFSKLILAAALGAALFPAAAQTTLRFAQLVPPTHPYHGGILVPWTAEIAKATGGRVKMEITPAPLGPMPRNYDMVQQGIADAAGGNHALSPGRFQITQLPQTWVGTDTPEAVSVAFWRTHKRHLEKANEHEGVHLLALHTSGPLNIFSLGKEVKSIADLKGMKMLAPGVVASKLTGNVGAVPVVRPVSEYYDVVSKGVVDGLFATNSAVGGFKVEPFVKHHIAIPGGFHFSSFFVVVNKTKWDALPKADRDAIESVSGEAYARLAGQVLAKQQDEILAARKKEGRIVQSVADEALTAELRKGLAFFDEEWGAAAKAKGIDAVAALKYFRDEAAAYKR